MYFCKSFITQNVVIRIMRLLFVSIWLKRGKFLKILGKRTTQVLVLHEYFVFSPKVIPRPQSGRRNARLLLPAVVAIAGADNQARKRQYYADKHRRADSHRNAQAGPHQRVARRPHQRASTHRAKNFFETLHRHSAAIPNKQSAGCRLLCPFLGTPCHCRQPKIG